MRLPMENWNPPSMPEINAMAGNVKRLASRPGVLLARPIASNRASRTSGAAAASTCVAARTRMPAGATRRITSQLPSAIPAMKAAMTTASCWYT
jgi:hypothetical protein